MGTDDRSSCNPLPVARPAVCPRPRNGFELDASRSGRVGKSERRRRQSLPIGAVLPPVASTRRGEIGIGYTGPPDPMPSIDIEPARYTGTRCSCRPCHRSAGKSGNLDRRSGLEPARRPTSLRSRGQSRPVAASVPLSGLATSAVLNSPTEQAFLAQRPNSSTATQQRDHWRDGTFFLCSPVNRSRSRSVSH